LVQWDHSLAVCSGTFDKDVIDSSFLRVCQKFWVVVSIGRATRKKIG
jgi:hypothetical protein